MSESSHVKIKTPLLGDKTYGVLKKTATLVLPALGALYFTLAQIWDFPKAAEVNGSIAALNTFIGALVLLSSRSYSNSHFAYDGTIVLDGGKASIQLHHESEAAFLDKDIAILKVDNGS